MASVFPRKNSPWMWIRYKSEQGTWEQKPTCYRQDNAGDRRQAELLARKQSEKDATRRIEIKTGGKFSEWVLPWIISVYGEAETSTPEIYKRGWRMLQKFLERGNLHVPSQIRREFIQEYLAWRLKTAGRNMAIGEIKLFGMILKEAKNRHYCTENPLERPGLKKAKCREKELWEDAEIIKVSTHVEKYRCLWQRTSFYFGLYQACRLRQCQLPVTAINFERNFIRYPDHLVKGMAGYTQPIDPRFRPILEEMVATAKKEKRKLLCEVPWDASIRWRKTLDRCGLPNHSHHGLRVTWITRAADNDVSESKAMAFAHHESAEVHRIYKKLKAVVTVGVPSSVSLPCLFSPQEDLPCTISDNAAALSSSQIPKRSPGRTQLVSSTAKRRSTARVRLS